MLAGTLWLMHRGDSVTTWLWLGRPARQQVDTQVNRYNMLCSQPGDLTQQIFILIINFI